VIGGGDEPDLAAQLQQARTPQALHRRQIALLAAMAIVAVAFGGAVGPRLARWRWWPSLGLGGAGHRPQPDERALIGEAGAAGAGRHLRFAARRPAGGRRHAAGPGRARRRRRAAPRLAAAGGRGRPGRFSLVRHALLHGGDVRVQLPAYVVADNAQDLLPAVLPALLGGLAGLAFVTLLPWLRRQPARCGGVVVQTLVGSLAFAALATAWPILRHSGHHQIDALLARGQGAGWAALLLLAGLKVLALGAVPGLGWRGGAIFPLSCRCRRGAALALQPQVVPPWRWWRASRRPPRSASASPQRRCSSSPADRPAGAGAPAGRRPGRLRPGAAGAGAEPALSGSASASALQSRRPGQTSIFPARSAFVSMKSRRGSTSSPISMVKTWSASMASSICTRSRRRTAGSMVVSHSCSGFISPRPL
jgi:hypothetical protein